MYIVFIIGIVFMLHQIYGLKKLNNKRNDSNKSFGTYKHKSHIGSFYMSLLTSSSFYIFPILDKKYTYLIWISPIVVNIILKYKKNSQQIEIFDTGMQVFGDFIEWERIKQLEYADDEIAFVTSDKDPLYYTVMKIEKSEICYREIVKLTPHLNCI